MSSQFPSMKCKTTYLNGTCYTVIQPHAAVSPWTRLGLYFFLFLCYLPIKRAPLLFSLTVSWSPHKIRCSCNLFHANNFNVNWSEHSRTGFALPKTSTSAPLKPNTDMLHCIVHFIINFYLTKQIMYHC